MIIKGYIIYNGVSDTYIYINLFFWYIYIKQLMETEVLPISALKITSCSFVSLRLPSFVPA